MASHRDGHQPVTPLPDQAPEATPLGAHDQRGRRRQVDVTVIVAGIPCQADRPPRRRLSTPRGPARC